MTGFEARRIWMFVVLAALAGCDDRRTEAFTPSKVADLQEEARAEEQARRTEACAPGNVYEHARRVLPGEERYDAADLVEDRRPGAAPSAECLLFYGTTETCLGDVRGRALLVVTAVPDGIDPESLSRPLCGIGTAYLLDYQDLYYMMNAQEVRRGAQELRAEEDHRIQELLQQRQR